MPIKAIESEGRKVLGNIMVVTLSVYAAMMGTICLHIYASKRRFQRELALVRVHRAYRA